jgi:hypothetical protein
VVAGAVPERVKAGGRAERTRVARTFVGEVLAPGHAGAVIIGAAGAPGRPPKRSDLAGWAEYGYCASHSHYFWGLRLHLVCTLHGLPVAFALAGAKADERETLADEDGESGWPHRRCRCVHHGFAGRLSGHALHSG